MRPLFRSRFDIRWDGIFIVVSAILLLEVPSYVYAATDEIFFDYQFYIVPLLVVGLCSFYSLTMHIVTVFPAMVLFERPLRPAKRKIVINKDDIAQVELEPGARPKLKVYHHATESSIYLYEDEVAQVKKAFAHIGITVD